MAYTRIHAIKSTVQKSVDYICDPDKTLEGLFVSSFSCTPKFAGAEFKSALSNTNSFDENKAYHLIQSFAPGEVSHEEAHRIGIELADRLLKGNFSYVVATHTDRDHPHNHIVFCAASNTENVKFNSCKRSYYEIRHISDELCREHNLSIIQPSGRRGKSYKEWMESKRGNSWKDKMRKDIDEAVSIAVTYEEFLKIIREKGYEVKGDNLSGENLKYISFRAPEQQRFVRGSLRSLGEKYTREEIINRINSREISLLPEVRSLRKREQDISKKVQQSAKLIDTSGEKFQSAPGLKRWAEMQNLKVAASSYAEAGNLKEFRKKIEAKQDEVRSIKEELKTTEQQLKELKEVHYYLTQYKNTVKIKTGYDEAKDKEAFLQAYEEELGIFDNADFKLRELGIRPSIRELNQVKKDIESLTKKASDLSGKYDNARKSLKDLEQKYANITQYLGIDKSKDTNKNMAKAMPKEENNSDRKKSENKDKGAR